MAASRSRKRRYRWQEGMRLRKEDAAAMGEVLDALRKRKRGRYEARDIVEAARDETSPIHHLFEWDDTRAAEFYREHQARKYVRALIVDQEIAGEPRSFHAGISFGPGTGYLDTETAMKNPVSRQHLVSLALQEHLSWERRYEHLRELAELFEAADRLRRAHRGRDRGDRPTASP